MGELTRIDLDRIEPSQLKDLAKRGIIRIMTNGVKPVGYKYTDLPEYKRHAKWKGQEITVREASREFKVPTNTISQWVGRNLITVLRRTEREIYLDKADVAYCALIREQRRGSGRWLFNQDRTPHVVSTHRPDRQ